MHRQVKHLAIFILILISLASAFSYWVYAIPPTPITVTGATTGIAIRAPELPLYNPIGKRIDFDFHLFNASTGLQMINKSTCDFHLYNSSGRHIYAIYNQRLMKDKYDIIIPVSGSNFTQTGVYSYIFQCNYTGIGGGVTNFFYITNNGLDPNSKDTTAGLSVVIFLLVIALSLYIAPLLVNPDKSSKYSSGILKRGCWILATYLMLLNVGIVKTIAEASSLLVGRDLNFYIWLLGTLGWLFIAYTVIRMILEAFEASSERDRNKRMGDNE